MERKQNAEALATLMALGKAGPQPHLLDRIEPDCVDGMFCSLDSCQSVGARLTNEEIYALFRGLVLAGGRLRYGRSSVSPASWFARLFSDRCPELYPNAGEWLNEYCDDAWVRITPSPYFDYVNMRPMTEVECDQVRQAESQRRELERQQAEDEARALAQRKALRAAQAQENRTRNLTHQAVRREQRSQVLERLADVSPVERLCAVVSDLRVGLDFYPPSWGVLPREQRMQVPGETVEALLERSEQAAGSTWRAVAKLFREDLRRPEASAE